MTTRTLDSWRFGAFQVDRVRRLLLKDGEPVPVTPKSFDVLALLLERRSDVVTKEEIMAKVWAGLAVEESNLTFHISAVRRALGDSGRHREYIVTLPGRGYRFVAPVEEGDRLNPVAAPHEEAETEAATGSTDAISVDKPLADAVASPSSRGISWKHVALVLACLGLAATAAYFYYWRGSEPWQQLTFDRAEDTQPDVSRDGRQVVFVSNRQGHDDIWVMGRNGSGPRNLTVNTGVNDSPAWSPDGGRIAFQRSGIGGLPFIFVMNADGSSQRRVSPFPGARVTWSPDGKSLAYQAARGDHVSGIFRLDLASGTETRLTDAATFAFDPAWSPDGLWIAHTRRTPHGMQIFTMDASGGQARQLTWFYGMAAHVPTWSHEGNRIAFTGLRDREEEIYLMRADGSEVFRLTQGFPNAVEAAWSPDDGRIFFGSDRAGNSDVYSMEVPQWTARQLTRDIGEDTEPVYSPDGRQIAFVSNRSGNRDVWVQDLTTGRARQMTHDPGEDADPAWSPDGSNLAFASNRTGRAEIFVLNLSDGVVRQVSPEDGEWVQPSWSPDGSMLAAAWGPLGSAHLRLLPMNGGKPIDLASEYFSVEWPAWSADGSTIAFATPMSGKYRIYSVSTTGGAVTVLTDGEFSSSHPVWRPDGALAFNRESDNALQIMLQEPGHAARTLTSALPRNFYPAFSKDGGRVVFVSNRDGNLEIYEIND